MRNDTAQWSPDVGFARNKVTTGSVTLAQLEPARQTLVSGPYQAALALAELGGATGWAEPAQGETYALRLRRDRILVVNGAELADGWHDAAGLAVSDMTAGYSVFEITGNGAFDVLRRGTEISLETPSASVARAFYGYPVLVYAVVAQNAYRIHTPRGHGHNLWALLKNFCEQVDAAT